MGSPRQLIKSLRNAGPLGDLTQEGDVLQCRIAHPGRQRHAILR
ncbi:hypothetical protein [Paraburkholderia humisilvae]|nr:hypothetical protein [Paraburkholderia humisilvae]